MIDDLDAAARAPHGGGYPEGCRVAIATGGSAGHITAALAIGDAFEDHLRPKNIVYIGTHNGDGFENRLIARLGKPLERVRGSPLMGEGVLGKARALWNLWAGWRDARRVLTKLEINLVVGCGGYGSVGVLLAARSLGLPCALHEANALPGRANRLAGRFVDRVHLGWDGARPWFDARAVRIVGNPVRARIANRNPAETPPRRHAGGSRPHLLVLGGSLGSPFLNRRAPALMAALTRHAPSLTVTHQTGGGQDHDVRAEYARLGIPAAVEGYIDDIYAAYARADFAVVCGGAMTLAEVAAVGLPSLVVPLGAASDDHQSFNARAFSAQTGVPWVREKDWDATALATRIGVLLSSSSAWNQAAADLRSGHQPGAGRAIATDCLSLVAALDRARVPAPAPL